MKLPRLVITLVWGSIRIKHTTNYFENWIVSPRVHRFIVNSFTIIPYDTGSGFWVKKLLDHLIWFFSPVTSVSTRNIQGIATEVQLHNSSKQMISNLKNLHYRFKTLFLTIQLGLGNIYHCYHDKCKRRKQYQSCF